LRIDNLDRQLAEVINNYPRLFVLTGAGCSTASGLGDYRDVKGQWKRAQPITGKTFTDNVLARKRYWARSSVGWPSFQKASPSLAHTALVEIEKSDKLSLLVTQNVDRLHQKAGHKNVVDLHGVLDTVRCLGCQQTEHRNDFQLRLIESNPWLTELSAGYAPDGDADLEIDNIEELDVPSCKSCGGLLKPDVVFFGENVPRNTVISAMDTLRDSDALLVAGSSLMVYSGFRFCREAQKQGLPIILINNGKTRADDIATLKVDGDCGKRLNNLAMQLNLP